MLDANLWYKTWREDHSREEIEYFARVLISLVNREFMAECARLEAEKQAIIQQQKEAVEIDRTPGVIEDCA